MGAGLLSAAGASHRGYPRVGGTLHADRVPLPAIAAAVGTPCYVYVAENIRARLRALTGAFAGVRHRVHFAVKANSSLAVLRLLREAGAGVDIVSGGELHRARLAGFGGADVVFSGVGKTRREITEALAHGVQLLNVESEGELAVIAAAAAELGVVAPIALRVNPEVTVDTPHAYIRTGEKGQKFGIPHDEVAHVAARVRDVPQLALRGLGMHLGSQIANADPLREALPRLLGLVAAVRAQGHPLAWLDVGGGLAVPYTPDEREADLADYARLVRGAVRDTGLALILEPGRFLVADAGVLLTTVLYRKQAAGRDFLVTDAGMGDLLRPALYHAHHEIEAVAAVDGRVTADVVGPICESGDFLARDRVVPDVGPGALLALQTAGAYGYTMASNYNSRPRPAEVLVDGDRFAVVTRRETYDDLVRLESAAPEWRNP